MRTLIRSIAGFGDYLMSLSDGTRLTLVLLALGLLGGGGVYKLVVSIQDLSKPQPAVSVDQFMEPMQKLFVPQPDNLDAYRKARQELDSLRNPSSTPTKLPR